MTVEEIKETYSMKDIVERYGYRVNGKGFMPCPFHNEKTASMKIYKSSYCCYGCHKAGDIFSFVQEIEGIDFREAYKELGGDYDNNEDSKRKRSEAIQKRNIEIKKEQEYKLSTKLNNTLIGAYRARIERTEPFSEEWCYCQNKLMYQIYISEERMKEARK